MRFYAVSFHHRKNVFDDDIVSLDVLDVPWGWVGYVFGAGKGHCTELLSIFPKQHFRGSSYIYIGGRSEETKRECIWILAVERKESGAYVDCGFPDSHS